MSRNAAISDLFATKVKKLPPPFGFSREIFMRRGFVVAVVDSHRPVGPGTRRRSG